MIIEDKKFLSSLSFQTVIDFSAMTSLEKPVDEETKTELAHIDIYRDTPIRLLGAPS